MVAEAAADSVSPPPLAVVDPAAGGDGGSSTMAVHGHRISTVVPSSVTGESVNYELPDADLLHKLHYVRAVHVFRAPAAPAAFSIEKLKEPMFPWLDTYFPVSGRLRRRQSGKDNGDDAAVREGGRPFVRCNDCGVRIVEVACDGTVEEWLKAEAEQGGMCKALACDKVIGPELFFSPLLYVQVTSFKCGGMALGFTWAHLIGDIPSAAACFSNWAQLFSGSNKTPPAPTLRAPPLATPPPPPSAPPASVVAVVKTPLISVKATAAPVGDHWAVPTTRDMVPFSFHVTEQQLQSLLQLHQLSAPNKGQVPAVGPFELLSALMWRALAAIRGPKEEEATRTVTVVRTTGPAPAGPTLVRLANEHRIGHVTAPPPSAAADVAELAALLASAELDEASAVAALAVAGAEDADDVVVYGANLTFVDAEAVDVYGGLELGGRRPAHVEYAVDGVGDGGATVVHRDAGGRGRTVAGVVRRGEADRLRAALRVA